MDGAAVWRNVILPAASALSAAALTIVVGELTRRRRLKQDTRIAHLTSQIREFYGPIYCMLKARNAVFRSWNKGGPLQAVNDEVRNLFVRQNDAIERLVLDKAHLIEVVGGRIPDVIGHLDAHVFIWNACIQRFGEVPPHVKKSVPEATWPENLRNTSSGRSSNSSRNWIVLPVSRPSAPNRRASRLATTIHDRTGGRAPQGEVRGEFSAS